MTDLDAMIRAANDTDDETPRLAYLDAYQEEHGETDWVLATREFYAKCKEPRRYEHWMDEDGSVMGRRALPGWREWLAPEADEWTTFYKDGWNQVNQINWPRLLPTLCRSISKSTDHFRRNGSSIVIRVYTPTFQDEIDESWPRSRPYTSLRRASLTFARGFLQRIVFVGWRDADAILPAILADQPFVEAGIRGQPVCEESSAWSELHIDQCGPAINLIPGAEHLIEGMIGMEGENQKERAVRARAALSRALKKRARSLTPSSAAPA